ncbi:hypothetical protein FGO68_gene7570 [Halteria grandinella]|uniref:Uncharacterized protein n=1 Tax=Halteria grandinella TaxID=5974 RepID=A0A8J8NID1_HALGN|nr:hypothetical protein FGO68_gene7570 [Halteria grandinella]
MKALSYNLREIDNISLDSAYNYIFIISEVEYGLYKQKQEHIEALNKQGVIIVTADQELSLIQDPMFFPIQLKDWNKLQDSPNLLKLFFQDKNLRQQFEAQYNEKQIQDLLPVVIKRIDEFLDNENAKK